jgi:predicted deacylase
MADHRTEDIRLCRLPSGTAVRTTLHRYVGSSNGPTVYVQAAQHGREITGCEILRRIHDVLEPAAIAGEVRTVPVASPITFDHRKKTAPEALGLGNPNMNSVWPGETDGTLHQQAAARLWDRARDADVAIDLHSISPVVLPHVRLEDDEETRELARAFGTELHFLTSSADTDASDNSGVTFRTAAHRHGIPCLTPELGYSRQLVEHGVEVGVTGVCNVLRTAGVLSGAVVPNGEALLVDDHLVADVAQQAGLFVPERAYDLGDTVDPETRLGTIYDPKTFEQLQQIETPKGGVVWYIGREAVVSEGDGVVGIAVPADG